MRPYVTFEFLNITNDMISHTCFRETTTDHNQGLELFEMVISPNTGGGAIVKHTGKLLTFFAVDGDGLPYLYDIGQMQKVVRISDMSCFVDGKPYEVYRNSQQADQ
ncbi:hypothetical protein [Pectobacterium zantedeschiae]|nr:hypothetical protein [Pectobacterium zantedeschiae]